MSFKFIPSKIWTGKERITLLESGIFWINRPAAEKFFKGFERVALYWDTERKVVGLKPTRKQEHTHSLSKAKGRNDITVCGLSFLKYTKINHSKTQSFEPVWNEKEKLVEIRLK